MMITFHPLANIFPLVDDEKFDALVADIKANGLREKIVKLGGSILDGRNRYRAGIMAEVVPSHGQDERFFRDFNPEIDGTDPLKFVISKNLARRHLNDDQRRMVAARLVNMGRGRPSGDNPAECGIKEGAKAINTDVAGTERARTVLAKGDPKLQAAVDNGKLSVAAAAQAVKLAPEVQRDIAQKAESGQANVVRTVIKQGVRDERERELGNRQHAFPDKKYGIILADPEWEFKAWNPVTGIDRSAVQHYPVSDDKVINARNVQKISDQHCILFLWCVDPARGVRALEAWGFEYKTYFVWVKDIVPLAGVPGGYETVGPPGMGYWKRDRCELLLVGTRGKVPAPAPGTQSESVFFAPRPKIENTDQIKHSAKPEAVHEWIERHFPTMPKIELNARMARAGWDAWGLEAPKPKEPEDENQDRHAYEFNQDSIPQSATEAAAAGDGELETQDRVDGAFEVTSAEAEENHLALEPVGQTSDLGVTGGESAATAKMEIPEFLRRTKATP